MSLEALRRIVSQYAANEIDHAGFRHRFVSQFLSVRHLGGLDALVHSVESACADYAQDIVSEAELKGRLARTVLPTQVLTLSHVSFTAGERCQRQPVRAVLYVAASNPADSLDVSDAAASHPVFPVWECSEGPS